MPNTIFNPDFREIDTPWGHEPIAWRYLSENDNRWNARNKTGIHAQISIPTNTHIVREVQVLTRLDDEVGLSVEETLEDLALVDEQFRQLEAHTDIKVAPTEWFVFQDEASVTRTLARVAIIDKAHPEQFSEAHPRPPLRLGLMQYTNNRTGMPLLDIHSIHQYVYGRPRLTTLDALTSSALYLVDIEPMLRVEPDAFGY